MVKWKYNSPEWDRDKKPHPTDCLYEVFTEDLGNFVSGTGSDVRRQQFIDAHNADCDAYEARIAELEAELARVKAESLRVVPDGEPCELVEVLGRQKFSMGDHSICEMVNPGQYDRTVDVRDLVTGEVFTSYRYAVNVLPVKLVKWEDES